MCQFVLPAECLGEVRDMKTEDTYTSFSAIKCTVIDCRNRCIIGVCVFPWNWQTPIIICILVVKHLSTSDPLIKCHFFDVLHYQFAELPLEHLEKDNAVARPTKACQKEFHHLFWRNLYFILCLIIYWDVCKDITWVSNYFDGTRIKLCMNCTLSQNICEVSIDSNVLNYELWYGAVYLVYLALRAFCDFFENKLYVSFFLNNKCIISPSCCPKQQK